MRLSKMLLAVDIGNTNIKLALFKGSKIVRVWRITTEKGKSRQQYERLLRKLFADHLKAEQVIVCSVVPKLTTKFSQVLFSIFKARPLVLGRDIIAPIKNLYKRPRQVGQDRLANAVAAFNKYGGPVIIVDFGTALTFDVVSARGSYLGGIIVPGMELSLNALTGNADLLPKVKLVDPGRLLGQDTVSSSTSGMIYGYAFLVEGLLRQLRRKLGAGVKVVATGGRAGLMLGYCKSIRRLSEHLTLE
ncbi:MAG: type III pantothenate kinase, partial [Candidatus Omnitrophica bacterium]|nr:type III pantothenate kinase [Candidatus Omnitrophota bacterium]